MAAHQNTPATSLRIEFTGLEREVFKSAVGNFGCSEIGKQIRPNAISKDTETRAARTAKIGEVEFAWPDVTALLQKIIYQGPGIHISDSELRLMQVILQSARNFISESRVSTDRCARERNDQLIGDFSRLLSKLESFSKTAHPGVLSPVQGTTNYSAHNIQQLRAP